MVQISSFTGVVGLLSLAIFTEGKSIENHHHRIERRGTGVTPTAPGPGASFNAGQQCPMQWNVGTSTKWKSMTIDLMTGDNESMVKLTNVATGIDGTSQSSHSWTCPEVTPNAPIYFYQFTDSNGASPTWTTRFTIASDSGNVVSAPNATQPGTGAAIPWGIGQLSSSSSSSSSSSTTSSTSESNGESSSNTSSNSETSENSASTSSSSSSSAPSSTQSSTSSSLSSTKSGAASMNKVQIGAALSSIAMVIGCLLI